MCRQRSLKLQLMERAYGFFCQDKDLGKNNLPSLPLPATARTMKARGKSGNAFDHGENTRLNLLCK